MRNKMNALMIGILIFGSIMVLTGLVLKILHVPFYKSVLISGIAFDFLGVAVYFLGVRNRS